MDTLSDYIWRTIDQIFSIDSSCARLTSGYWDPEVEIWRRIQSRRKPSAGDSIIEIDMDTLSDYIWRKIDQIFSIASSCARLASSYWDPEVEIWRRM